MRCRSRFAGALLGLLLSGCPSLATRQTANPIPPGEWELLAGVDGALYRDVEQDTRVPSAVVELGARHGVVKDIDAHVKLYTFGAQLGGKWRFHTGTWPAAVAPALDVARVNETQVTTDSLNLFAHLPWIIGHQLSRSVGLHFGPELLYGYYLPNTGGEAHGLSVGGFGLLEISLSERWAILPELSLRRSVAGAVPVVGWIAALGSGLSWKL